MLGLVSRAFLSWFGANSDRDIHIPTSEGLPSGQFELAEPLHASQQQRHMRIPTEQTKQQAPPTADQLARYQQKRTQELLELHRQQQHLVLAPRLQQPEPGLQTPGQQTDRHISPV